MNHRRLSVAALAPVLAAVAFGVHAASDCSDARIAEILAPPTAGNGAVLVDCNLSLGATDVVRKSLYFDHGAVSNGVVVDCGGALLSSSETNAALPRINVQSLSRTDENGVVSWERPQDIVVRNCVLEGNLNVTGAGNQNTPAVRDSSRTNADHTQRMRDAAPTGITFDGLTVHAHGPIAAYLYIGVTGVTISHSTFDGFTGSTAIYLDAESGFNRIVGNRFDVATTREVIAVDGSSDNLIQDNVFAQSPYGGVFLYRNCGEAGTVRHNEPSRNDLFGNRFLDASGPAAFRPHVFVAARNGNRSYCADDAGFDYGSSVDDRDHAHFTAIQGNDFAGTALAVYLAEGPSYLIENTGADAATLPTADAFGSSFVGNRAGVEWTPSGACFVRREIPLLLRDGQASDLDFSDPAEPACAASASVCSAGRITTQPSTCAPADVVVRSFRCALKASDAGCSKALQCGRKKRLAAVKAACDLEALAIDAPSLAAQPWNSLAVQRASDIVADGHCAAAGVELSIGTTQLIDLSTSPLPVSCRESDADGGDCAIKGSYACR